MMSDMDVEDSLDSLFHSEGRYVKEIRPVIRQIRVTELLLWGVKPPFRVVKPPFRVVNFPPWLVKWAFRLVKLPHWSI